jgi:hypothetical protein
VEPVTVTVSEAQAVDRRQITEDIRIKDADLVIG